MGSGDSPRSGRIRNRLGRIMERRRLRRQRKLEAPHGRPTPIRAAPGGASAEPARAPRAERQALAVGE